MNASALGFIISAILKIVTPDLARNALGKFLESVKADIVKSENKIDDALLPLIDAAEKLIGYVPPPPIAREPGTL